MPGPLLRLLTTHGQTIPRPDSPTTPTPQKVLFRSANDTREGRSCERHFTGSDSSLTDFLSQEMKMMEAKVRIALCALLLLNQGSVASATNNTVVSHQKENSTTQPPLESPSASPNATENLDTPTNITGMMNASSTAMSSVNLTSSNQSNISDNSTASSTPSNISIQNETSPTSATTPDPATNSTTTSLCTSSVSNTSCPQGTTTSQPSPSSFGSTKPYSSTTISMLNGSSTHTTSPSQLNVKGRNSPPLDPLLAGLVSAFIITAAIITLLIFLKLRRRDSGPQFTRLQDLPMDDMMEDSPLSMYNY